MARLISLEDIRRRYMLSVAEERLAELEGCSSEGDGDEEGVAAENKLGGFKNFAASASPDLLVSSRDLAALFFFPSLPPSSPFFSPFLSAEPSLSRSTLVVPSSLRSFPRGAFAPRYLVCFVIMPVMAISRATGSAVRPLDASRGVIFYSNGE